MTEILGNLTNLATKSKSTHRNKLYVLMKKFEERIEGFFNRLSIQKSLKHRLCQHRYTCWMYSLKVGQSFGIKKDTLFIGSFLRVLFQDSLVDFYCRLVLRSQVHCFKFSKNLQF